MNSWKQYLQFEVQNNLFQYRDSYGTPIWDIFRYYVYSKSLYDSNLGYKPSVAKRHLMVGYKFYCLYLWLRALFIKGKYLFYLSSRNRNCEGYLYDKNAWDVMHCLPLKESIIIESYSSITDPSYYKYGVEFVLSISLFSFLSKRFKTPVYDFTYLYNIINAEYPQLITTYELEKLYRKFYSEKKAYAFWLKRWRTEKVFFTQNGIQKGLIAACRELQIPIYEFQHGIVTYAHSAYSYPINTLSKDVFLPNVIFSFSDFWFQDVFSPGVSIIPIGNDSFVVSQSCWKDANASKSILVVSANIYGQLLAPFVQDCLQDKDFQNCTFFFKLHPNQYSEFEYYADFFKKCNQVCVIKDEFDIPSLLAKVDTVLLITSTAAYEGLQAGDRICILKRFNYFEQEHLFDNPNVHLVNSVAEFKEAIQMPCKPQTQIFFSPFDKGLFNKCMNE